jgi:16S rRNA U1498 N3-methylase RsmE
LQWKEALEHAKEQGSESVVPKVHLHATSEKALDVVSLQDLKKHTMESEVGNVSNVAQSRKGGMGGAIRERTELAGKGEMTGRE